MKNYAQGKNLLIYPSIYRATLDSIQILFILAILFKRINLISFFMYYKRVLLGNGMHLFPVFRFCWKRMILGAQLMTKITNKRTTYFQGVTVHYLLFNLTIIF